MLSRVRRNLTFANVCSFIALTVALGTGGAYAANTVGSSDVIDESLLSVDVKNGSLSPFDIQPESLSSGRIFGLDGTDVDDGSLGAADLADDSVGMGEIATNGVGASELSADSVDGDEIADGTVGADEIGGSAVGSGEIANGAVGSGEVANDSIVSADVDNGSLTGNDLAGGASDGAISVVAGAVPSGRCEDFDASVPGAQAGDAVIFSLRTTVPEGLLFYGVRAATDVVVVKVCNFTGGTHPAVQDAGVRILTVR